VMRTGVAPVNPLYWPGHDAPMRYYYFWYVTCGVIAKLGHISARQAFIASCVWPVFAVASMLGLYGKYLLGWTGLELRKRTRVGIAMLAITGVDGLVVLLSWMKGGGVSGDMEWWSIDQVTSWLDTFLWVPHHAAALVCCLLSFLLIWMSRAELRARQRWILGVGAGLSFASAFGLSTYIAIAFALVMVTFVFRVVFVQPESERVKRLLGVTAIAAVAAAVCLGPYVVQLGGGASGVAGSKAPQHVLALEVRQILDPVNLTPMLTRVGVQRASVRTEVAALILLLPGYGAEFGFFALAVVIAMRLPKKSDGERTLLFLFFASLASVSFLRSTVISTNDYGMRAVLLAQFFALPLAVRAWETGKGLWRAFLVNLAIVGLCGTIYQGILLRVYLARLEAHGDPVARELAERNYALHDAYAQFEKRVTRAARIQYDTSAGGYFNFAEMMNAQHQMVTSDAGCNTSFGGEMAPCAGILQGVQALFPVAGGSSLRGDEATAMCGRIGAQYLVVTRWDAVWGDASAWPWRLPVIVVTPDVRMVMCDAQ
jgi:hypothetical protein